MIIKKRKDPERLLREEDLRDGQEENIDFHFHDHFDEKEEAQFNKFPSEKLQQINEGKKSLRTRLVPFKAIRGACDCKNKCLIKINESRRTAIHEEYWKKGYEEKRSWKECDQGTRHQEKM